MSKIIVKRYNGDGRKPREAERVHLSRAGNTIFLFLLHYSNHHTTVSSLPSPSPVLIHPLKTPKILHHANILQISSTRGVVKCCPMPRVWWTCLENVTQDACKTSHVVIGLKHGSGLVCSVRLIWQGLNPGRSCPSLKHLKAALCLECFYRQ